MKIPLSWLKEFIDINETPACIAKLLTQAGLEVDGYETVGGKFKGVVVGTVLEAEQHPNADKLRVAKVTDGKEIYQVVCAAPNCRKGLKTAFAPIGASIEEKDGSQFVIKKAKLRGIESSGMLCSSAELQLGVEQDGIIEIPDTYKDGTLVSDIFSDTVFEISLTPNLGHCSSVVGVARELSAVTGIPLRYPEIKVIENPLLNVSSKAKVTIEDKEGCPRYTGRIIENLKVGPSPDWLKQRLEKCGIRTVNNVVDATNYVLMELGHPLHAFDLKKIHNHHIIVNKAKEGTKFVTLDGKDRLLSSGQLLISDEKGPLAVAGVMGGTDSEVTDSTTSILLESAYFDPIRIRRSSKSIAVHTDASKRFERGTDPNGLIKSLDKAASLIQQIAGGDIASGVLDVGIVSFPKKLINCRLNRINELLGTSLNAGEVEKIFDKLEFSYTHNGKDIYKVEIPTYRTDIGAEIDLVEEVARLYGYDNIPKRPPRYVSSTLPHNPIYLFEERVRALLMEEGLQEFLTCDLIGPKILKIATGSENPTADSITVVNPTSVEQSILRTSMLPGLLQVIKNNFDHQNPNIAGFEIGRVHFKDKDNYTEQSVMGIILSGKSRPYHWDPKPTDFDFYDLKGIIENILAGLGIEKVEFKNLRLKSFHDGRQASVYVGSLEIGSIGEIHPSIQRRLDVAQRMFFAEFDLHNLLKIIPNEVKIGELQQFPGSERDWTITLKNELPLNSLLSFVKESSGNLLGGVELKDIYRSERLGADWKNVTLHFTYRDPVRTLDHAAVDAEHERITKEVSKKLGKNLKQSL